MRLLLDAEKLALHRAFYAGEPMDRPLFGSWLFGFYVHQQYPNLASQLEPGPIRPEQLPIASFLDDIDQLWEAYTAQDDDYPFSAGALFGIPWLEAILGCEIHFSGTNFYSKPWLGDYADAPRHAPNLSNNPWAEKLLEFLDALVAHAAGRFACGPTLMRGPADLCAALRGGTNAALDTYDCPENLAALAAVCTDTWIDVGKAQLALVPESDNGYLAGCAGLRVWTPQRGIWLQDDAVSVLSPKAYRTVFLPEVHRIVAEFECLAFHLHGNTLWPVDLVLPTRGIDVLELNYDVGLCDFDKVLAAWGKIQRQKPCIAFADMTLSELDRMVNELLPTRLSIQTISPTLEDARAKRDLVYGRGAA